VAHEDGRDLAERPPPGAAAQDLTLVLGGVARVALDGRSMPLERKAAGLLAWLALEGPTPRERVASLLWPNGPPEAARNSLRQLLFRVRKAGGPGLLEPGELLGLAPAVGVDGARLEPLLAGHDFADTPSFDDWLHARRERWAAEGLEQRLRECDAAEARGELAHAAELARTLVERDPLGEPGHLRWARVLYLRGERDAALQALAAYEGRLRDELGVEPTPRFRELLDSLRAGPQPARTRLDPAVPVTVLRPPRLIGREPAIAAVRLALAAGGIPLIVGEPGQGKSRLVAELLGPDDRVACARPSDAALPYASLARLLRTVAADWPDALQHAEAQALRPLLPDLIAEPGPGTAARERAAPLAAAERTLALAHRQGLATAWLDDLQFFDAASLEALEALLEAPALAGLGFVLARRPAEGGVALSDLVDRLGSKGRLVDVVLQPLGDAEVEVFIDSLGLGGVDARALAPSLRRATAGNPLFMLETLKAALLEGRDAGIDPAHLPRPGSVLALIHRRLARLSPEALNLARVAALAGLDFDAELAAQVLERPALDLVAPWAELEAGGILRDQAFAHDLIVEVALAGVPPAIGRAVRRRIADALERRGGEPARIAAHWIAAQEHGRAAPHLRAAGRRAEAALRYPEARDALEQAARCHDAAGQGREALMTRLALADLWTESGDPSRALAQLQALQDVPAEPDDVLRVADETAKCLNWLGRTEEAERLGLERLDDAELVAAASPREVALLRNVIADVCIGTGRPEAALAQLALTAPYYASSGDAQESGWHHSNSAAALRKLGQYRRAGEHLERALALARETGRLRMVAGVLQQMAGADHDRGHPVPSLERAEEALRLMKALDGADTPFTRVLDIVIARDQVQLGRLEAACEQLDALRESAHVLPATWPEFLHVWRLRAWAWAGQPERARDSAAQLAAAPPMANVDRVRTLLDLDLAVLREAGSAMPAWGLGGATPLAALTPTGLREAVAAWCSPGEAAGLAGWRDQAREQGNDGLVLMVEIADCRVASRGGDAAQARRAGEAALAGLRRFTVPGLYRPTLWLSVADDLRVSAPDVSVRALRDAAEWIRAIAGYQLPAAARRAFLERNPVNRRVLALHAGLERAAP
jgi:DNA-binding SARP family transcriptional activator/tetratricopeptide (TPR) repeat protein